jgi:hypothetical protein
MASSSKDSHCKIANKKLRLQSLKLSEHQILFKPFGALKFFFAFGKRVIH